MIAEPDVLAKMVAEPGISRSFCGHLLCLWMFACHVLRVVRSLARLSRRRVCKFFLLAIALDFRSRNVTLSYLLFIHIFLLDNSINHCQTTELQLQSSLDVSFQHLSET